MATRRRAATRCLPTENALAGRRHHRRPRAVPSESARRERAVFHAGTNTAPTSATGHQAEAHTHRPHRRRSSPFQRLAGLRVFGCVTALPASRASVYPHTSNWPQHRRAYPWGWTLRGKDPVHPLRRRANTVRDIGHRAMQAAAARGERFWLAAAPEGTRSPHAGLAHGRLPGGRAGGCAGGAFATLTSASGWCRSRASSC